MFKKLIPFFFLFYNIHGFAQKGPGGVGVNDGASSLVLWLDANQISGTDASTITTWTDKSGYGYDLTVGNGAVFNKNRVNSIYPAFTFNGTSHYFQRAYTAALNTNTFTIFSANKTTSSGLHKCVMSNRYESGGVVSYGYILYAVPTTNYWEFWSGDGVGVWDYAATGTTSTAGSWGGLTVSYNNTTNKNIYVNGTSTYNANKTITYNASNTIRVGAGRNETTANYFFNGDIGELIQYNAVLNSAEQIIVNNYLASKYSYALTANDIYDEDDAGYDHDVAGIGRVDASNLHNSAQGTGVVKVSNPTGLGDNEFYIWGHDNGANVKNTSDVPSPVVSRMTRVWRGSEVNVSSTGVDVGSVDISWDLSANGSVTASDLRLLVDTDNDGTFADETPISGATASGSVYTFSGVSALANNLRFTLGTINYSQTPLPVDIIDFSAQNVQGQVKLNWKTWNEKSSNYFVVLGSNDGINFEKIGVVNAKGNSSNTMGYSFIDQTIHNQSVYYYKLQAVDFDGYQQETGAISVHVLGNDDCRLALEPNPASEVINAHFCVEAGNAYEVSIENVFGETIYTKTIIGDNNGLNVYLLPIQNFSDGLYLVEIIGKNSGIHHTSKFIKK